MDTLIDWARSTGSIRKIALRVRTDNARGIALYREKGFEVEGTLRQRDLHRRATTSICSTWDCCCEYDMLYMIIEYFNAGAAPDIYRRARERGRQLPDGLEYVDSWVDLDYYRCFQVMRTDDRALIDRWIETWRDLAHFEVIPVRTSAEAARNIADAR